MKIRFPVNGFQNNCLFTFFDADRASCFEIEIFSIYLMTFPFWPPIYWQISMSIAICQPQFKIPSIDPFCRHLFESLAMRKYFDFSVNPSPCHSFLFLRLNRNALCSSIRHRNLGP
jgi:hypothetical protein